MISEKRKAIFSPARYCKRDPVETMRKIAVAAHAFRVVAMSGNSGITNKIAQLIRPTGFLLCVDRGVSIPIHSANDAEKPAAQESGGKRYEMDPRGGTEFLVVLNMIKSDQPEPEHGCAEQGPNRPPPRCEPLGRASPLSIP